MKFQFKHKLPLAITLFVVGNISFGSNILLQRKFDTHLRWNIFIDKEQVSIKKKNNLVTIKTLHEEVYDQLKKDLSPVLSRNKYFQNYKFKKNLNSNFYEIELILAGKNIDLFSFYRNRERKFVLDFWRNRQQKRINYKNKLRKKTVTSRTTTNRSISSTEKSTSQKRNLNKNTISPTLKKKILPKTKRKWSKKNQKYYIESNVEKLEISRNAGYRDFRYGASFIWDYKPFLPKLKRVINLDRKTPEFFYPIKNRKFDKSEKEGHLQLVINLYRKRKFGLMYKAMTLFERKYGTKPDESDLFEYIKANSLIRKSIETGDQHPVKMAINMYIDISERTKNYELKKGVLKYLISHFINNREFIQALTRSKKFYVTSKEHFDYEETEWAARSIFYNLANLNQNEKVTELLDEKTILKILPKQVLLAYQSYTLLKLDKSKDVIKVWESNKLTRPIHPAILFNTGEAYFRNGKFAKAIKVFDEFLFHYGFNPRAQNARLRLALAYEIMDRPAKATLHLYRDAINKSVDPLLALEAKIRYVGLISVRKQKLTKDDREKRVFLEIRDKKFAKNLPKRLKKLLWLTRLRTLIVDKEFQKALSYLNAIPLNTFLPSEKRVFEGDGSEIVYGIIMENYKKSEYSIVVKYWESYKDLYIRKVATDPNMNFVVGKSFVKLGMYSAFDNIITTFTKVRHTPDRTFPLWYDRGVVLSSTKALVELSVIKSINQKKWDSAITFINELEKMEPGLNKIKYYRGVLAYNQKRYKDVIKYLEKFLWKSNKREIYDVFEMADVIQMYANAIYYLGDIERFKSVSKALLADSQGLMEKNKFMKKVVERIHYLYIETLSSDKNPTVYNRLESEVHKFLKKFPKNSYADRVKYLLAVFYIRKNKINDGKKIFSDLLQEEGVANYIKEMARAELSLLEIKEKTI